MVNWSGHNLCRRETSRCFLAVAEVSKERTTRDFIDGQLIGRYLKSSSYMVYATRRNNSCAEIVRGPHRNGLDGGRVPVSERVIRLQTSSDKCIFTMITLRHSQVARVIEVGRKLRFGEVGHRRTYLHSIDGQQFICLTSVIRSSPGGTSVPTCPVSAG